MQGVHGNKADRKIAFFRGWDGTLEDCQQIGQETPGLEIKFGPFTGYYPDDAEYESFLDEQGFEYKRITMPALGASADVRVYVANPGTFEELATEWFGDTLVGSLPVSELLVLGDLFHSRDGLRELSGSGAGGFFEALGVRRFMVPGNHDRHSIDLAKQWGFSILPAGTVLDGIGLFHEPPVKNLHPALAGHLHPSVRLATGARSSLRIPAFLLEGEGLVLPAFGDGEELPGEPIDTVRGLISRFRGAYSRPTTPSRDLVRRIMQFAT